jgi:hypothetical protein
MWEAGDVWAAAAVLGRDEAAASGWWEPFMVAGTGACEASGLGCVWPLTRGISLAVLMLSFSEQ